MKVPPPPSAHSGGRVSCALIHISRIRSRLPRHQGNAAAWQRRLSPERNGRGEYLLWLTEAEANRLAALRRRGESYSDTVIRLAKEAKDLGNPSFSM